MAGLCDYTGTGDSVTSFLCNASTGNLSAPQVQKLADDAKAAVIQAAGVRGQDPTTQEYLGQQVYNDINTVLSTFKLPGESGSDVGALPSQASAARLPGIGNTTLDNLESARKTITYVAIGAGVLVALAYLFPIVAPQIGANIKAARSLR